MEEWQNPETLAIWFGIILLFVLTLVVSIIYLVRLNYQKIIERAEKESLLRIAHQRQLLETSITIQEKERDRIAADLHDGLIGKLTVIRLQHQVGPNSAELDNLISESITEARRISHDLSPPLIEHTPINELIKDLTQPWNSKFFVDLHFDLQENFYLSKNRKTQLVRIMQEIITNIDKHAEAESIQIHLRQTKKYLAIWIKDNGKGITQNTLKKGLGLSSIESRVQYMSATYKVRSKVGLYTAFTFILGQEKLNPTK